MKNRYLLLFLLLLWGASDMMGQNAQTKVVKVVRSSLIEISGTIHDKNTGETLPGVNIQCRDPKTKKRIRGTVSDLNGGFKIRASVGTELYFTNIGMKPVTYKVKEAESGISIYMMEDVNEIEETVIVGERRVNKANVTSSDFVIKTEELAETPVANVMTLLQGRVPGMNIQLNNGLPGAQGSITIRGISDISVVGNSSDTYDLASSTPLFVVDGIPQTDVTDYDSQGLISGSGVSPLSTVPFEDIANIQILKDAAATSLYGSDGAYGVILIETKKGNSTKPKVSYSANFTVSTPPRLRDVAIGNAERNLLMWQILNNDTSKVYHGYQDVMFMPQISDSLNPYWNNNTDWQKQFYRVTYNQSHNVSFSEGNDAFNYKINGNYYTEKGIVKNTDFNRYSFTGNMNYRSPNSKFSIGVDMKLGFTDNSTGSGSAVSQSGVASASSASSLLPPPSLYTASVSALQAFGTSNSTVNSNYSTSINLSYRLPFNIQWRGTFNYSYNSSERENFKPAILNNDNYRPYEQNISSNESKIYVNTSFHRSFDLYVAQVGLTAGIRYNTRKSTGNTINSYGMPSDYILGPVGYGSSSGTASVSENQSTFALIFNPSFSFKTKHTFKAGGDKYIFTPSLSPEISSVYGTRTRWLFNPALGFRWNIGYESFMERFKTFMDNMSIRATWGRVVKYRATRYDVYGSYDVDESYTYDGESYIPINFNKLPNINLDPVTTTSWNLGYDLSLFNRRFSTDINFYYRQVDNQLSDVQLPDHSGFSSMRSTDVSLINYGLEVFLRGKPLPVQSKWNMDLGLNFSINRDVIAKLPNEARQLLNKNASVANRLGGNATSMLLYINKGVYATDEDVPVDPATGKRLRVGGNTSEEAYFKAGDPIWVDVNGDYVIDENDRVVAGNSQPRVNGGLYMNLSYKNFSVHVNTSFIIKRDVINTVLANTFSAYSSPVKRDVSKLQSGASLAPIESYNFWSEDNRYNAVYPNPYDYHHNNVIKPFRVDQTLFLEDGSYFKINTVSCSYRLPKEWLNVLHVSSCTLKASVNNIWTFSGYSGISPESVNSLGRDTSGGYPNARTWTVGFTLSL